MTDQRPFAGATELRGRIKATDTEIPVISVATLKLDARKRIGDEYVRCSGFGEDAQGWPIMTGCERGLNPEEGGLPADTWPAGTEVVDQLWSAVEVVTAIPTPTLAMVGRQFVYKDALGNVYTFNVITSPEGTPVIDWVNEPPAEALTFVLKWLSRITGLVGITGVDRDSSGNIYVTAGQAYRKYNSALVQQWALTYIGGGSFEHAATDGTHLYLTNTSHKIVKFLCSTGAFVAEWGTSGLGDGQFNTPLGLCTDGTNLWIVDDGNHRVQKFLNSTGAFISKFGSIGTADGQFTYPTAITLVSGKLWVLDAGNGRVQRFNAATHAHEATISFGTGNADGQINFDAEGIGVDSLGRIWISDRSNHRIQVFDAAGVFLFKIGTFGSGAEQFKSPAQLTLDATNMAWIADSGNGRLITVSVTPTIPLVTVVAAPAGGDILTYDAALGAFVNGLATGAAWRIFPYAQSAATVATNASNATYQTHVTTTFVLPAGTWEVTTMFWTNYYTGTAGGGVDARVSSPVLGSASASRHAAASADIAPNIGFSQGSVSSDGATPTTFTVQYKGSATFAAGTVSAWSGALLALCRRTG